MKSSQTFLLLAVVSIIMTACNNSSAGNETASKEEKNNPDNAKVEAAGPKKYQIKSATITYETVEKMGNFSRTNKSVVYFDDYGMKERKDTYDETGNLRESFFSDGKTFYLLIHSDKSAYNRGSAYRGTELKFDWNEISPKDKESGLAKKAANEMILGKDCEAFYHESKMGKTKFAGWQNVCLLIDLNSSSLSSKTIAVDLKEDLPPASTFTVPSDYTLQKTTD